jgi:transcriptional regulator with XRE-family HTH domain
MGICNYSIPLYGISQHTRPTLWDDKNMKWMVLINLRESENKTSKEMAAILGKSKTTYSNWELEKAKPSYADLIKIADHFKVTIDFLLEHEKSELVVITKEDYDGLIKAKEIISKIEKRAEAKYNIHDNQLIQDNHGTIIGKKSGN